MRTVTHRVTCFAPLFTPSQLQPSHLLSITFHDAHTWLKDHLGLSHRDMLERHQLGFVVYGTHLTYRDPLRYQDADTLETQTSMRVRRNGQQLDVNTKISAAGRLAADVHISSVPLWISEGESLSAVPTRIEEPVLSRFRSDEREATAYVPPLPALFTELERSEPLASGRFTVTLSRHNCEFADQWYFAEVANFAARGRETLAFEKGSEAAELRRGLKNPLRRVDMMFKRPGYLFDTLVVDTRAYVRGGELLFAHRVWHERGGEPYALVAEYV